MDNHTATLILSAYRSGGEDATDPVFAGALEQARLDPELAQWLGAERALDEAFKKAVQSESPPPHLRDSLLVGNRVTLAESTTSSIFQRHSAAWIAVAAVVALLLVIGFMAMPGPVRPIAGDRLVEKVFHLKKSGQISLGKLGGTTDQLRSWLAAQEAPHDFAIPAPLLALGGMGCQVFEIDGHKISLVCFMLDQERLAHFFVIDSDEVANAPGPEPEFVNAQGLVAATWSAHGRTYVLTSADIDEQALRELI